MDLARVPELLAAAVERTGPYAPAVLFGASFGEYVFPPLPGDAVVVLGAWYAVHGSLSWPATFAAVTAGATTGAALHWKIGRIVGPRLEARAAARGPLSADRMARFEASYRRWGPWLLLASRFLPGVRAFLFIAAGASGIRLREVILLGGLSAALWNAALLGAGALVAENLDEMLHLFQRYQVVAGTLLAIAAGLWLVRAVLRRRLRRSGG